MSDKSGIYGAVKQTVSRNIFQFKLIGRGTPSGKGRDHPSRRATKLEQLKPISKFYGQLL